MEEKIRKYMNENWRDCIDSNGDLIMTLLVEACAHSFNHDEWLDDETHIVWDIATEYFLG